MMVSFPCKDSRDECFCIASTSLHLNLYTTNVPNLDSAGSRLWCGRISSVRHKETSMVAKIAQLLVGAMTLFNANINQTNLVRLWLVHFLKVAANNNSLSTYFRAIETYMTCVLHSKYKAELVYMVLMYSSKTAVSLAVTEMLEKYR